MKLYYFRGEAANFGDELNLWLMPKVFPGLLNDDPSIMLLAIGSVLFDTHPKDVKKIVLGTGWGGYTAPPVLDDSWDIRCVRGPLTAKALDLPASAVAGDTAILMRNHYEADLTKRVAVSFMPHFESIKRGNWEEVCRLTGIRFIDPRLPVEDVMAMLCESELVLTEAMHGAIVSDALRVPWIAIKPIDKQHHMKWHDWAGALDLKVEFRSVSPSSLREALTLIRPKGTNQLQSFKGLWILVIRFLDTIAVAFSRRSLLMATKFPPQLSSENAIARATARLQDAADGIIRDAQA
jgi:Polysaccharide pyruvyl transferase